MSKSALFSAAPQPVEPPERIYGWLDTQLSLAIAEANYSEIATERKAA